MDFVVGSGPAGIACAAALVGRGRPVTVIDGGLALEPERAAAVARLAGSPPERWPPDEVRALRAAMRPRLDGIPRKLVHGSDFPYRDAERAQPLELDGAELAASLATGGFSNVWGAAVLPYLARDIDDWPVGVDDLAPHYAAVLALAGHAAVPDELAATFPLYGVPRAPLPPSAQAVALLADLRKHAAPLGAAGFAFGASRLLVRAADCTRCGLCMHGCPYGLIWSSHGALADLARHGVRHLPGHVVERVHERGGAVLLSARRTADGAREHFEGSRAFLACGPVATTRLLLASLGAYGRTVTLRDSQYFLLPWLRRAAAGSPATERLHTLCQAFLELSDPAVSRRTVHMEVFGWSDLYPAALESSLGPLYRALRAPFRLLLDRLLVLGGFLHSDDSATIDARLEKDARGGPDVLHVTSRPAPRAREVLDRVVRSLWRQRAAFRAVPVRPLLKIAAPGKGFHSGGSFPMRARPAGFESDALGRPAGFTRVHAVDATVFPSVPATTITLSVMANAHRIGAEAPS